MILLSAFCVIVKWYLFPFFSYAFKLGMLLELKFIGHHNFILRFILHILWMVFKAKFCFDGIVLGMGKWRLWLILLLTLWVTTFIYWVHFVNFWWVVWLFKLRPREWSILIAYFGQGNIIWIIPFIVCQCFISPYWWHKFIKRTWLVLIIFRWWIYLWRHFDYYYNYIAQK